MLLLNEGKMARNRLFLVDFSFQYARHATEKSLCSVAHGSGRLLYKCLLYVKEKTPKRVYRTACLD